MPVTLLHSPAVDGSCAYCGKSSPLPKDETCRGPQYAIEALKELRDTIANEAEPACASHRLRVAMGYAEKVLTDLLGKRP